MTISLLLLSFTALGLLAAIALFVSLKREIAQRSRREEGRVEAILSRLEEAKAPAPAPIRSGVNLSKKAQVMHLRRQGQDAAEVAAILGISRREVELMLRVSQPAVRVRAAGAE